MCWYRTRRPATSWSAVSRAGIVYDAFKAYEDEINAKRGNLKVNVVFFPTTRDRLVPDLLAGLGDVVAAGFTITTERDKVVDFAIPATTKPVSEIVVTGPQSPQLTSIADLAGKEVFVRKSSSYWEHLEQLNASFKSEGQSARSLCGRRPRISKTKTFSRCSTPVSLASGSSTTTRWRSGPRSSRRSSRIPTWP